MSSNTAVMMLMLVGVGIAAYVIYQQNTQVPQPPTPMPTPSPAPAPTPPPSGQTTVPVSPTQVTTGVLPSGAPSIYQNVIRPVIIRRVY